ncbi:hypothetical protein PIB30_105945, partial [Stylosanthes scabra]|nr:hypothetical protein [Stylosanthes scabra]
TRLVVETTVEKGDIAEKDANLVVETNVEKGDIAEKESVIEQGDIGLLPSFDLSIDFGSQSQSQSQPEKEKEPAQETEKHDQDVQKEKGKEIQQHQGPEIKTPEEAIQKRQYSANNVYSLQQGK